MMRSIESDRTSLLSSEQSWGRPNKPCFDVSSMLHACIVQDAVLPNRLCQDPYGCPWDPLAERILSVCCSNFVLPVSTLNWWWNVNWLHIQYDQCTRRNCPEITLSCSVGSMGLRPEWPWRARRSRISCPDGSVQCWKIFLFPPPFAILLFHISSDQYWEYSNSFRRSSFSLQNSIATSSSRGNSPCRRRVCSVFATGYALLQYQSIFFHEYVQLL